MTALAPERHKVIVDPFFRSMDDIFSAHEAERLADLVEVVWGRDEPMPLADFEGALPEAVAIVSSGWRYGQVLDRAESLRAVISVSGGWPPELDYAGCFARGIRVLSVAPAFGAAVAEMALALALACARDVVAEDRAMRAGEERFLDSAGALDTFLLHGKQVGFVGFGNIGRRLRRLLEPFGCEFRAFDPWLTDAYLRDEGVEPDGLERLLESSRLVFVLAIPTTENAALLSRDLLELVRPDAVLVLMSRAHVVDFDALTELVLAGRFRAALDVYPGRAARSGPSDSDRIPRGVVAAPRRARTGGAPGDREARRRRPPRDRRTGLPPRRLQVAEPELATRYVRTTQIPGDVG